ncbi:hypothetical protein CN957_23545 [Bacillus cereus]|nr:hypothetical protein CN957_23545 [Bacillus cereus]
MVGLMRHNKVFSMVFSIVSIFILMFSMVFPHSKASAEVLTSEKYNNKGWVFSKHLGFFLETDLIKLADGRIAYCLDERLSSPNGNDLEPMGRLSDEAYRVMAYGYPERQPSELGASNWQEAHFGTQIALWVVNTDISYNDLRFDNPRVKAVVDNILNDVRTKDSTQDLTFEVSPTSHVAHVEGDYFKAGAFKVTTNAKSGSYTPQAINAPKGTYFTNANGEKKTTFNSNEDFYVYFNKNEASGTFQIKVSGDLTKTETLWYKSNDAGVQNSLALVTTKHTPVQENLAVNWASKGSLELNKVDENGTKLAGAKFDVKNAKGETVATITTDENGYGKVDNLDLGTYTVVETQAPNGYVLDATPQKAQVNNGEVANIKFVNKLAKGEIEINKVDDSNKPLAGVEFTVYNEKGEEITKVVTDKNGKAFVKDLAFGKYSFKETKGLDGYIGSTETYNFEVKENGKVQTFTVTNKLVKGSIEIHKVDDNKKPLSDVEFTVYNEKGEEVTKVVTDKNGVASVKDLPYGKYTFKETKAKNGYEGSSEEISFEITKQGSNQVFNVVNKLVKGSIEIHKVDDNKKPLSDVEFTVYNEKGEEVTKVITNKNGIASVKDLPYGKYTFKETKGLTGYVANSEVFNFEITKQGSNQVFNVVNKLVKGSIEINKTGDNKQPLEGVEFTVYNKDGKEITKVVTDKDGKASVKDLPYGKYSFKETKAKTGYVANDKETSFEVKEDGKTQKFDVVNKLIRGNIEINKTGDNKKPLSGVEFGVYDLTDKEITKVITDKDGKASVKDLPYGSYYFKETKTVEGYVINTEKTTFTVKENNKTQKFNVVNKLIKGNIEIHKVGDNKQPLEGVEFTIYDEKGNALKEVITDKNGIAKSGDLPYGSYHFKETKAKTGYVINKQKFDFDIKTNGQTLKFDVTNKLIKGSIEITKVNEENQPLQGVEFTVYDQNNKKIKTVVTDKDGKAKVDNLIFGKYYFKETKTIEGYVINNQKFDFSIEENAKTLPFTVTNKVIKGNVKLVKVDADNEGTKLKGAVYELFDATNEKVGEYTTNENGEIAVENLVYGSYKFVEKEAPTGYVLDTKEIPFEVKENGQTIELTATNKGITGTLEITKVDIADSKPLSNAKFQIINEKGEVVVEKTTDEKGKATFEKLPFGKYTFKEISAPEGYFINETVFNFEILENGKIIKKKVEDEKIPSIKTTASDKTDNTKEMHTSKSVTIQDEVEYKDLQVGKEYTLKGKLMDKSTNKPLLVNGKEVTSETKFTPKKASGSITLDFTFDATGLEDKEVVVFEDLLKDEKIVTTHADIEDKGQTVKFVKPSVKTTATNKADGSKELDANESVTIQDKVEYKDLIVGKEYVVKGKLMDKATNKPLKINGKEVTSEAKFTAENKDGFIILDFTFNASELQGKEVVVFEELYQNDILVAIHSDIEDMGQTVKFKEVKPEVKPEQPKPEQPKPEQPKPEQPLPQTGGQEDNTMKYAGLGLLATALAGIGYTVVTRRRKQEQN